ncbi:hypothetical protein L211DRAFT_489300 [Terfezia boudieri ATCC MYA-4762]|uniref:Uncharacterized protein n=1 Tax=Terfezia boudieri ATCC MYA-4762 TaxID=1051890 RepID=A0A3N4LDF3_9PEZI|nr:hypothetical protein L211DRAFT_489300 [Terfezia boudieri ATCC MYA-4762]
MKASHRKSKASKGKTKASHRKSKASKGTMRISKGKLRISKGKLKDLEGKTKDLEGKTKDLEGKIKDLEGKTEGLTSEIKVLKSENKVLKSELSSIFKSTVLPLHKAVILKAIMKEICNIKQSKIVKRNSKRMSKFAKTILGAQNNFGHFGLRSQKDMLFLSSQYDRVMMHRNGVAHEITGESTYHAFQHLKAREKAIYGMLFKHYFLCPMEKWKTEATDEQKNRIISNCTDEELEEYLQGD